jgi:hypothetical protein
MLASGASIGFDLLPVGNIELRKSFFGDALVGEVQPALSWADHRALADTAHETRRSSQELDKLNGQIASLGFEIGHAYRGLAAVIGDLEDHLGLRLHMQTQVLTGQLDHLARIHETLRTPAKTRAAERIADTGELLRRGRWERALAIASEAIEDDPNGRLSRRGLGADGTSARRGCATAVSRVFARIRR